MLILGITFTLIGWVCAGISGWHYGHRYALKRAALSAGEAESKP